MLVSVNAMIKGHHVYRQSYPGGTELECVLDPENEHSESAIVVKYRETIVGHIPEGLCQPLTKLFKDGDIVQVTAVVAGEPRPASVGTFVRGGGIEIPCSYRIFGRKERKRYVRAHIKNGVRKLAV